jgi:hypothetical protein
MNYLTAENILQSEDFAYADVECPEWGGTVRVRSLSGAQRVTLKKAIDAGQSDIDEMLCVMCIVDADGNRIFNKSQIAELSKKNTKAISRVAIRVLEISGMRDPEKSVKDAEKNSGEMESAGSSYD